MTTEATQPAYTRRHWAKSEPRDGHPKRIHLLEHHLADVGACFEALLAQSTIRQRLARSGGLADLDGAARARLSLFAALHDIGKVNTGFQTQIWQDADLPAGQRRPHRTGHTLDITPVLSGDDGTTAGWFFDSLGWWDGAMGWDDRDGETVCALFVAALSHHGQPLQLEGQRQPNPAVWRSYGELHPEECVRRIGRLARQWFPAAWDAGAAPLPSTPAFQHHFLGLCTLADWIGSNEQWFPFCEEPDDSYIDTARRQARRAVETIGLDINVQRSGFTEVPGFAGLFGDGRTPNAIQQAARDAPLTEPLVIIESETGSGKTEAALWRFARMYDAGLVDGLYFALPTRAAASQIFERVKRFAGGLFGGGQQPEVALAVPGYLRVGDATGQYLQNYEVWWDDHAHDGQRWASESPKRYLAAQIAVGTVDQAMMAALKVRHAHMRAACLSRNLLVVDEVHASDAYMRRILKDLLDAHRGAGGYALLMSATLGSAARRQWLSAGRSNYNDAPPLDEAIKSPYPAVSVMRDGAESIKAAGENRQEKAVAITSEPLMGDFDRVAELALQAARDGAKVLVIRNTVAHALETQQALERAAGNGREPLFSVKGVVTLHHGRFTAADRKLLDAEVEARLGRGRGPGGVIVVGTQTLEQSLDIDADLLITDLCPADVLLQRIGRLHRHQRDDRPGGYETPACVALAPDSEDLAPLLRRSVNRTGLGPYGYVYPDLRVLEATRRLIAKHPRWDIPRMNRELVERATHPAALETIVEKLGDDWREHANSITGGQLAEGLTAANAVIRRDKSFFNDNRDMLFGADEERIRTRLGDESVDVELTPPPSSPLDDAQAIERLSLPHRWLAGADADATEPVAPSPDAEGFTFAIGNKTFRYDRLGLRPEG